MMEGKLRVSIFIFFLILSLFIGFMIKNEYKNLDNLSIEYPNLKEEVYGYRKESLNIWAVRLLLSFILPMIFLTSKLSQKISYSSGNGKNIFISGFLYGIIFFGIIFLINLPVNFYSFILHHKYGLTNQTFLRWLELNIKGYFVNCGLSSLFLWIPYYFIYSSPNSWWIKLGFLSIPIVIFLVFISPFVIDPIFNNYNSIKDEEIGKKIELLLEKSSISHAEIYKVDKSKDTKTMNAYMTGIFKSKRIVLWDTTIDNLTEDELLSITAHEIGHYLKGHIWWNILFNIIGTFILLYLIYSSSNWILYNSRGTFGFKNLYNYASLPLLIFLINLFTFFSQPIQNYFSRTMEIEADRYEISLTNDRESAISAMEKLYDTSLGLPRPSKLYKLWYHSHPTLEERVEFYREEEFDYIF